MGYCGGRAARGVSSGGGARGSERGWGALVVRCGAPGRANERVGKAARARSPKFEGRNRALGGTRRRIGQDAQKWDERACICGPGPGSSRRGAARQMAGQNEGMRRPWNALGLPDASRSNARVRVPPSRPTRGARISMGRPEFVWGSATISQNRFKNHTACLSLSLTPPPPPSRPSPRASRRRARAARSRRTRRARPSRAAAARAAAPSP